MNDYQTDFEGGKHLNEPVPGLEPARTWTRTFDFPKRDFQAEAEFHASIPWEVLNEHWKTEADDAQKRYKAALQAMLAEQETWHFAAGYFCRCTLSIPVGKRTFWQRVKRWIRNHYR